MLAGEFLSCRRVLFVGDAGHDRVEVATSAAELAHKLRDAESVEPPIKTFEAAATFHLPTQRGGQSAAADTVRLKNQLREASVRLFPYFSHPTRIKSMLEPAWQLVDDDGFWKEAADGLAIFITPDRVRFFRESVALPELVAVGRRFHVRPLLALVGEEGKGFRYILSGMNAERILIAAECIGDAKWFIEKAKAYASEREVFGRPIGQNQGVQFPIARCYAQMRAAELMVHHAAHVYDQGGNPGEEANMAKLLASEASWAAADMCVQTFGGFGFAEEYDVERKFREARLYTVAPISTNLILSYLAEHVLGLPRSY